MPASNPKVTYYRKPEYMPGAHTIHMVADFPAPKGKGYSQCGKLLVLGLEPLTRAQVRKAQNHEFCLKCTQLIGLV